MSTIVNKDFMFKVKGKYTDSITTTATIKLSKKLITKENVQLMHL